MPRMEVAVVLVPTGAPSRGERQWDPGNTMPNQVSAFVDAGWEGHFCDHPRPASNGCVVFELRWDLKPHKQSTLQRVLDPDSKHAGKRRSMCNSLKLHFFHQKNSSDPAAGERRRDFMYSSAVPLHHLAAPSFAGLFNFNINEKSTEPFERLAVCVVPLRPICIPPDTVLLAVGGADASHHARVLALSLWIERALQTADPSSLSPFAVMRTFGRDYCSMLLFQDLHRLFDPRPDTQGMPLPPGLAVYALCNALITNDCSLDAFMTNLPNSTAEFGQTLLGILRDLACCFSHCVSEGVYWSDESCDQEVEDQPFVASAETPSKRIFRRDDCEGRAAEVQLMVQLLRAMAAAADTAGGFETMTRSAAQTPSLALTDSTLRLALMACVSIGKMLREEALQLQTVVGDVRFACMREDHVAQNSNAPLTGHSFALASVNRDGCKLHRVVETTGWERLCVLSEDKLRRARAFARALPQTLKDIIPAKKTRGKALVRCTYMSMEQENQAFQRIVIGQDYIYFTRGTPPRLGAHLADMRSGGVFTYDDDETPPAADAFPVFRISTRRFLREHCADARGRLFSPVKDAETMLAIYQAIQDSIPQMRRAMAPPSTDEDSANDIMREWGKIEEQHLRRLQTDIPDPSRIPCWFSIKKDGAAQRRVLEHFNAEDPNRIRCHPFMHSVIFRYML